jgi:hypothetical protein
VEEGRNPPQLVEVKEEEKSTTPRTCNELNSKRS